MTKVSPQPTFFSGMFRACLCMISACVNCTSFSPQSTFLMTFHDLFLYAQVVPCARMTKQTPQLTFLVVNSPYHFCLCKLCQVPPLHLSCLEDIRGHRGQDSGGTRLIAGFKSAVAARISPCNQNQSQLESRSFLKLPQVFSGFLKQQPEPGSVVTEIRG